MTNFQITSPHKRAGPPLGKMSWVLQDSPFVALFPSSHSFSLCHQSHPPFPPSFIDLSSPPSRPSSILTFPMADSATHTSPPSPSPSYHSLFGTPPPSLHLDYDAIGDDDSELSPTQSLSLPGSVLDGAGAVHFCSSTRRHLASSLAPHDVKPM